MKSLLNHSVTALLWEKISVPVDFGTVPVQAFQHVRSGLRVIESQGEEWNDKRWYHVSLSYPNRTPNYEDVDVVRRTFIGLDRECFQIFPRQQEYVNLHPHTLHLFSCLDGEVFPDSPPLGGV